MVFTDFVPEENGDKYCFQTLNSETLVESVFQDGNVVWCEGFKEAMWWVMWRSSVYLCVVYVFVCGICRCAVCIYVCGHMCMQVCMWSVCVMCGVVYVCGM